MADAVVDDDPRGAQDLPLFSSGNKMRLGSRTARLTMPRMIPRARPRRASS